MIKYNNYFLFHGLYLLFSFYYGIFVAHYKNTYDEASLRRQMTKEGHVYFIIHVEGEPAGYVSVRPEDAGVFHLEKIYVLPDFQGCHCGSALFRHAVAYVRRVCPEARAIELNVNRQNPALGFYRRMGMRIDREGDFDIGNGFYMNDYIMRLEL